MMSPPYIQCGPYAMASSVKVPGHDGAVDFSLDTRGVLSECEWRDALKSSSTPAQLGARLAWGISRGFGFKGLSHLLKYAKPFASSEASLKSQGLFPLPVSFAEIRNWAWPQDTFSCEQCRHAWLQLVAAALNDLHGAPPPYPARRGGRLVKKCLNVLGDRIDRFLTQEIESGIHFDAVWEDISNKQINSFGEEVALKASPLIKC